MACFLCVFLGWGFFLLNYLVGLLLLLLYYSFFKNYYNYV